MRCLRVALVTLLCLAVLPWGSWRAAQAMAAATEVMQADETAMVQLDRTAPRASAPAPCHGAFVPGSPCGPDQALPHAVPALPEAARLAWFGAGLRLPAGIRPEFDLPPPRPL